MNANTRPRVRLRGLQPKILAWSFVPSMIILMAVAVVNYYAYQDVTARLVIGRNRELTRLAAGQITAELKQYADLLDAEARTAAIADKNPAVQKIALQQAGDRLSVFDGGTLILDTYGQVVTAMPERPDLIGENWSDRPYYQQILRSEAMASPGPVFSDIVTDGPDGVRVVVIAVPIKGPQGGIVGAIVGMFRASTTANNALYGDLLKLRLGDGGIAMLVDHSGQVIFHTDPAFIAGDASRLPDVQQVISGQADAVRTRDSENRDILSSFAPVPGTSWGLVEHESWKSLIAASSGYRWLLLLLLALGVLVPALVVTVGVRRITRPIRALIGAAQKVAGGDLNPSISVQTGDEIEELAGQFNVMATQLKASYARLEERAEMRTRELTALNAIAAVVSQSTNLEDVLNACLEQALDVLGIEAGGIYILDEQDGVLTIAAQHGLDPGLVKEIDGLRVGEGFSGRVVQTGRPMIVPDVSADARLTRLGVREANLHSMTTVPLNSKGSVLGTLFAMTTGYREFTDQDVQLLSSIGNQIGIAIENARLLGQAEQRTQEMEALYRSEQHRADQFRVISEVGHQIASIMAVDELLWKMARLIREAFHYYHVGIGLIEDNEVVYRIGDGAMWEETQFQYRPERLKLGVEGISGWVAATGQPLLVPDVSREPRYVWMRGSQTRSELTVPIMIKGQVFGVVDVQSDQLNAFDAADLTVLQSLAHQAAIAIQNARLYEQAQQVAVMEERNRLARDLHDAVTQTLFSASLIAEALPELWANDNAQGQELLGELQRLSRGALAEMRTLLLELRPAALVEASLNDLLRQLGEAVTGRTGLPVVVTAERIFGLPADVHVALYRIAQEALNNVVKHANAHQVAIGLRCALLPARNGRERPAWVELRVRDDGRGFDPSQVPPDRLGLGIIRERAEAIGATLKIESRPGQGTSIAVTWSAVIDRKQPDG